MRRQVLLMCLWFLYVGGSLFPFNSASAAEPTPVDLNQFLHGYLTDAGAYDTVTLVTPDEPSEEEMRAVVTVAAGLGKLTNGQLPISVLPISSLTEILRSQNHLIFIGKSASFPVLTNIILPLPLLRQYYLLPDRYEFEHASDGYGVIQILPSPWNGSKSLLIVSASDDIGVVSAAQAVTTGRFRTNTRPDVAIVKNINRTKSDDFSIPLNLIGADNIAFFEGRVEKTVEFFLYANEKSHNDGRITCSVSTPVELDSVKSTIQVSLNGIGIGSIPLVQRNDINFVEFVFPVTYLRAGRNLLTFNGQLYPSGTIFTPDLLNISACELILDESGADALRSPILSDFPNSLTPSADLSELVFIIQPGESKYLEIAARVAYQIGINASATLLTPQLRDYRIRSELDDFQYTQKYLIFIGIPNKFHMLTSLGDSLPGAYEKYGNEMGESGFDVEYRYSGADVVGQLQIMLSPYDPSNVMLVIGGNSVSGVGLAADSLLDPISRATLNKNLALISDGNVFLGK